jgi:DNA (cytosine-5)-methyltransferase 1
MNHGSLFSGIGGFDLAAEWIGWNNVFHCEINDFGKKILNYYWPNSISYDDIKKTDFTIHRGSIDLISGGFPCQPYSTAGKRKGKEDERHLWPEMLRAITEIQPRWIVGENVRGIISWNGGLVFEEVQTDLEAVGYEVLPFLLPAAAVNAPHRRDRVWFVAYSKSKRRRQQPQEDRARKDRRFNNDGEIWNVADTDSEMLEYGDRERTARGSANKKERIKSFSSSKKWETFPTQSPICGGDDGIPRELDGITFPKWRNESIKGYGNAIVPQVVYQIFKAIEQYDNQRTIPTGS